MKSMPLPMTTLVSLRMFILLLYSFIYFLFFYYLLGFISFSLFIVTLDTNGPLAEKILSSTVLNVGYILLIFLSSFFSIPLPLPPFPFSLFPSPSFLLFESGCLKKHYISKRKIPYILLSFSIEEPIIQHNIYSCIIPLTLFFLTKKLVHSTPENYTHRYFCLLFCIILVFLINICTDPKLIYVRI